MARLGIQTVLCVSRSDPGSEGFQDWLDYLDSIAPGAQLQSIATGSVDAYPIGLMPIDVSPLNCTDQFLMAAAREIDTPLGFVPALSDNGASDTASCCRSLDGAVLGTHVPESKALGGASKDMSLAVAGSYVYVHDWLDATGRVTRRVRRCFNSIRSPRLSAAWACAQHVSIMTGHTPVTAPPRGRRVLLRRGHWIIGAWLATISFTDASQVPGQSMSG